MLVSADEHDSRLAQAFEILKSHGFELYPHSIVNRELAERLFVVRRDRTYAHEEILSAELLRLVGSSKSFAEFRTDESGESFEVEITPRLKNKIDFGCSPYHVGVLMSERLKLRLEAAKLAATNFKPVRYNKPPKPDTKRLWQFESTVPMPVCQTQRQDTNGHFVTENGPPKSGGYYWDDAGYIPQELVFKREEVQKLAPFDIAMTQEFVGESFAPYREIIVTQHFREAMEKHGVKTAEWAPVRLV